jgi:hypothetical protein
MVVPWNLRKQQIDQEIFHDDIVTYMKCDYRRDLDW